jgi:hypothetical protein
MADSPVQICNAALLKIGAERINALNENNKRARFCNERYDGLRKEVLRAHPWNFAMKRASLNRLATTPEFGFTYEYQLPADCLRVLTTEDSGPGVFRITAMFDPDFVTFDNRAGNQGRKFKIEGRKLVTDEDEVKILYISDIEDTTKFDPSFDDALSTRIAAEAAYPLVQSVSLSNSMRQLYEHALQRTRTQDGQEGSPDDLQPDFFLSSRF